MIRLHRQGNAWYNENNEKLEVLWRMDDGNVANITSACKVDTKGRVTLPDGLPANAQVAVSYPVGLRRSSTALALQKQQEHQQELKPRLLVTSMAVALYDPRSAWALGLLP